MSPSSSGYLAEAAHGKPGVLVTAAPSNGFVPRDLEVYFA